MVYRRPDPLGSLQRSPKPHAITSLKGGGLAAGGNGGDYGRKLQKRKTREKLKGNGKGRKRGRGITPISCC